jgi:hypothetical protein
LLLDDALLALLDDDVLLDDVLLIEDVETLLDTELDRLLVLDIEEVDETTEDADDADETLVALLVLEALLGVLDDTLDDTDEAIEELLTLPLPAALDELFATVPPLQAAISTVITAIDNILSVRCFPDTFIMFITILIHMLC